MTKLLSWKRTKWLSGRIEINSSLKSIEDQKFLKVLPNTANVIYSWGRKALVFKKCKVVLTINS